MFQKSYSGFSYFWYCHLIYVMFPFSWGSYLRGDCSRLCKQSGNFSSSSIIGREPRLWGNILRYRRFYNFPLFRVPSSSHFSAFLLKINTNFHWMCTCIVYYRQYVIYNWRHIGISMNKAFWYKFVKYLQSWNATSCLKEFLFLLTLDDHCTSWAPLLCRRCAFSFHQTWEMTHRLVSWSFTRPQQMLTMI